MLDTINEPETVVRRGAELLDEKFPLWWTKVTRDVNVRSTRNCVLAQIYGTYSTGLRILGMSCNNAVEYGFTCTDSYDECICMELSVLWVGELERRHEAASRR